MGRYLDRRTARESWSPDLFPRPGAALLPSDQARQRDDRRGAPRLLDGRGGDDAVPPRLPLLERRHQEWVRVQGARRKGSPKRVEQGAGKANPSSEMCVCVCSLRFGRESRVFRRTSFRWSRIWCSFVAWPFSHCGSAAAVLFTLGPDTLPGPRRTTQSLSSPIGARPSGGALCRPSGASRGNGVIAGIAAQKTELPLSWGRE